MKRLFTTALVAAALLVGCAKEEGAAYRPNGEVLISSSIATRVSDNTWEAGDNIGVYMTPAGSAFSEVENANVEYSTAAAALGEFAAVGTPLYYPPTGNVDLLAYYPYVAGSEQDPFAVTAYEVSVASQADQSAIDLMKAAVNNVKKNPDAVKMTFDHKLTHIVLNIAPGAGLVAADLENLVVTLVGTKSSATFDLTLADDASPISLVGEAQNISMLRTFNNESDKIVTKAEAIVIPQALSGAKFTFETAEYKTFEAAIALQDFEMGKEYIYNISINRTSVSISSPTINPWGEGNNGGEDLDANYPIPTTDLTLATVKEAEIDSYENKWIIADYDDTADSNSKFEELWSAVNAADDAGREITLVFPNLKTLPRDALNNCQAAKV